MKPRIIYQVEVFDGELNIVVCAFVRTYRDALEICSRYPEYYSCVSALNKPDFVSLFGGD